MVNSVKDTGAVDHLIAHLVISLSVSSEDAKMSPEIVWAEG